MGDRDKTTGLGNMATIINLINAARGNNDTNEAAQTEGWYGY